MKPIEAMSRNELTNAFEKEYTVILDSCHNYMNHGVIRSTALMAVQAELAGSSLIGLLARKILLETYPIEQKEETHANDKG